MFFRRWVPHPLFIPKDYPFGLLTASQWGERRSSGNLIPATTRRLVEAYSIGKLLHVPAIFNDPLEGSNFMV